MYKDGWKASVYHPRNVFGEANTTDINFLADFSRDKWELYNINKDWTEINNLAEKNPTKLEELKKLFDSEAVKYNVYPLRNFRDGVPAPVIRPKTIIYEGTTIKTRVYIGKGDVAITANIDAHANAEGVIFANGGLIGGTSLYIKEGKLFYTLNDGLSEITLASGKSLAAGKNVINVQFTDQSVTLSINTEKVAEEKITSKTKYLSSSNSDGFSVGKDLNSPVTKIYKGSFAFTGRVITVVIDQKL